MYYAVNFLHTIFFLLGLPFIHADCIQDEVCNGEDEERGVCDVYRQDSGASIPSYTVSRTCGRDGPIVTEDTTFFKLLASFTRERIPPRCVLFKGAGAHGYFEVTHDITEYTKAVVFSHVGKKTPLFCRFSSTLSAETLRGVHGFACKFYTTAGNWDLLTVIGLPVFNLRDPIFFASSVRSRGQNPVTGRPDANAAWDFFSKRSEQMNAFLYLFSDGTTPYGYRHSNGYAINTYVLVNAHHKPIYVKFTWKTNQGIRNFTDEESHEAAGQNLDWSIKDLYDSIHAGNYPSWTLCLQLMTFEQAKHVNFNPLDATAPWFETEFPCRPVGRMILNKNPKNYFSEVEQVGFSPSQLIPGIEPSPDRVLQGRFYAYDDAQRYRLGINSHQLPINKPRGVPCCPHNLNRDGFMNYYNQDGEPNYYPNSFSHLHPDEKYEFRNYKTDGIVGRHDLGNHPNYEQARAIYERFSERDKDHLAKNIANNIKDVKNSLQSKWQSLAEVAEDPSQTERRHIPKSPLVHPQMECKALRLFEGVSERFAAKIKHYGNVKCQLKYEE